MMFFIESDNTYSQSLKTFNKLSDEQKNFVCNGPFKNSPYVKVRISNKYGFCELYNFDDSSTLIAVLAVAPEYQGKGYGAKLFKQAEAKAKAKGYKRILYDIKVQNVNSLKLAKKLGLKLIGKEDNEYNFYKNI